MVSQRPRSRAACAPRAGRCHRAPRPGLLGRAAVRVGAVGRGWKGSPSPQPPGASGPGRAGRGQGHSVEPEAIRWGVFLALVGRAFGSPPHPTPAETACVLEAWRGGEFPQKFLEKARVKTPAQGAGEHGLRVLSVRRRILGLWTGMTSSPLHGPEQQRPRDSLPAPGAPLLPRARRHARLSLTL